jgi:tRNA pseudouridine38-40 synthase
MSPVKTFNRCAIARLGAYWRFDLVADAFLHHMIRNILGCLLALGPGQKPAYCLSFVLAARARDPAAPTFSPDGLYFLGPLYSPEWNLPSRTAAYDWLP